ncbi:glycoside hydrolase family 127 protein [Fulvivirga lutimaris]|nr:glycoside hydrolase family 127 protein [Fulvivirga lutimaris]
MVFFLIGLVGISCQSANKDIIVEVDNALSDYLIEPVDIRNVKVTDDFWLPIIQRVQQKTIEYAIEKCKEEGRLENFLIAGNQMEGTTKGAMPFDDTDVYKIIEGASTSLISSPNKELEVLLDSLITIIGIGQEADGYLTTWRTIDPASPPAPWVKVIEGKRWESLDASHEMYNPGHMYEAAVVHFQATGKRNFLDIAIKNADLIVNTFGPGKIETVPGHQIIETGLIKLYSVTGKKEYLELAKYFLDYRGHGDHRTLFGPYSQDHIPVIDQREVVGHAVRAVYMYAGMTDIAAMYDDEAYKNAIDSLWENMVNKKMYLTGGIGSRHDGEAFGENYELPNLTGYNETCAAIGDVYWNHRLFRLTGDKKYYDIIERTLYNGLISGLSLDGTQFFYPNALESDGKYKFNRGACTRQSWFDCSCCPTNVIRFIPSMPGLIYSKQADTVYVNLYAASEAKINLNSKTVMAKQETNYPWSGGVKLSLKSESDFDYVVKLRVPGWVQNEVLPSNLYSYVGTIDSKITLTVNGDSKIVEVIDGYVVLKNDWGKEASIEVKFPMEVRKVKAHPLVKDDSRKVALEYGPLVYAIEEIDNKNQFDQIAITGSEEFNVEPQPELLEGISIINSKNDNVEFSAIPYYAWSNRGIGKMKVWIPEAAMEDL